MLQILSKIRRSSRKIEGWSSKMLQISCAKSCKYYAIGKGLSSKCRRCRAKWEFLSPQCRRTLQNAEGIVNTTQTQLFVSLLFWPWWFRQFSFFLVLQSFKGFLALPTATTTATVTSILTTKNYYYNNHCSYNCQKLQQLKQLHLQQQ